MMLKTFGNSRKRILLPLLSAKLLLEKLRQNVMSMFSFIFVFILIMNWINAVKCNKNENDFYSSVAGLERLIKTEQILITDLKEYISTTKQQIVLFEKEIFKLEIEHEVAASDMENYLSNPVNAYKLINRLFNRWNKYEDRIAEANGFINRLQHRKTSLAFPTEDDFVESALALVRLQETYNLEVGQLASGVLNGVKYGNDMSWSDCVMLGEQLIKSKIFNQTGPWMQESIRRLNFNSVDANKISLEFMEILAENLLKMGDVNSALRVVQIILNEDPLRKGNVAKMFEMDNESTSETEDFVMAYDETEEFNTYQKVCRGELQQTPTEQRDLRCRYHTGDCAFCIIAPFKVEEVNFDPLVIVLHDMLSEKKIQTIKDLAIPNMKRSTVSTDGETPKERNYRISKNAWLRYRSHPYMLQMLRDIHDATNLDMTYSEELQVANYGLGGHYEPHFDFFLDNIHQEQGNRISTSIFYLSDVEQGGATAFPFLKVAVKPVKGSVLFWYNLHRSTDPDYRTKHAGCPVLKGSKWIANIWTHEGRQELTRPCGLFRDHQSSLEYSILK